MLVWGDGKVLKGCHIEVQFQQISCGKTSDRVGQDEKCQEGVPEENGTQKRGAKISLFTNHKVKQEMELWAKAQRLGNGRVIRKKRCAHERDKSEGGTVN